MELLLICVILVAIVTAIVWIAKNAGSSNKTAEYEKRRAGRCGEVAATNAIQHILRDGDRLFTNVEVSFQDKPAELDNVVVNRFGVFIIEVKNYKGRLYGNENDYEWMKYKDDGYGTTFVKKVKNPIRQVKRQVYVLAKYLDHHGSHVWVKGYALLLQGNSPVHSTDVLSSLEDIDAAIHTPDRKLLTEQQIDSIVRLLSHGL